MARNFAKHALAAAALWTTLFGAQAANAADPKPDESISVNVRSKNNMLEFVTRSWRPKTPASTPPAPEPDDVAGEVQQAAATEPLEPAQLASDDYLASPGATAGESSTNLGAPDQDTIVVQDFVDGNVEPTSLLCPLGQPASLGCDAPCGQCGQSSGCCCCCVCGPPGRFWLRDEYLGFWGKGDPLPALVNTGVTGVAPTTITLFGDDTVNRGPRSGNWVQAGMWLNDCKSVGIQGDYLFIGRQSTGFYDSSSGTPSLTRPFTNALTGAPGAELIAYPGLLSGNVSISDYNSFSGAGLAGVRELICRQCCNPCSDSCYPSCSRVDLISGFRYYNYNDNLGITENLTSTSSQLGVPTGTKISVNDSFRARNNFYGMELGLRAQRYYGRWLFEGSSLVALGENVRQVAIDGTTVVTYPGQASVTHVGGLYALGSNIGNYRFNNFMAIPQFNGRIGYRLTPRLTFLVGYTFIFWGDVAKAGNQVDTTVNPNLIPPPVAGGPARPAFSLNNSNFWAQGITVGGEYHF